MCLVSPAPQVDSLPLSHQGSPQAPAALGEPHPHARFQERLSDLAAAARAMQEMKALSWRGRGRLRGVLELRRPWGFSPEARRGSQGASRAAPGRVYLGAHCVA